MEKAVVGDDDGPLPHAHLEVYLNKGSSPKIMTTNCWQHCNLQFKVTFLAPIVLGCPKTCRN